MKGSNSLDFGPEKHQVKTRSVMQDLSRIKPQMMLKLLSSNKLSEDKKLDLGYVNPQTKGFHTQYEASSHAEMMELFPLSTGFGSNPRVSETNITLPSEISLTNLNASQCVLAATRQKVSTAQVTIFFKGAVNVYDMPAEKVQDIMKLARTNSSSNITTSTISSGQIEQTSQQQPSYSAINAVNENQRPSVAADIEIAKKLSLKRFLQKRKERFNSVAPYTTMERATLPWKSRKDSDEQRDVYDYNFKMLAYAS